VYGCIGQRPGEVVEGLKCAQIICQPRRTRQDDREVAPNCFSCRRGEKEKEKRGKKINMGWK